MKRYTKIICTLGPVSSSEAMMSKMVLRGMDVSRINLSHGDRKQQQGLINAVRAVSSQLKKSVEILLDLEGYRIRLGHFKRAMLLENNQKFLISNEEEAEAPHVIPIDYTGEIKNLKKGADIYIDDGKIHLKVIGYERKKIKVSVIQGGILKERKGVNIPQLKLPANILTEKDRNDLDFAIFNRVDFVAQSFVRNKRDISQIATIVKPKLPQCKIIAKIENQEGLTNLDGILDACDGIMIARGDLGVTMPIYKVPLLQKYIIRHCNRKKKYVITATQMLESMVEQGRPTRAEVSDVANAILDGTDYVMLSGETAAGRYPSRSIQMMSQIVEYTEKSQETKL